MNKELQSAQFDKLTKEQALSDQIIENKEVSQKLELEVEQKEILQNELLMLQARRYVIETRDVDNVSDQRLSDIEMQLFRSIQEINMEKGRRQIRAMISNGNSHVEPKGMIGTTTGTTNTPGTSESQYYKHRTNSNGAGSIRNFPRVPLRTAQTSEADQFVEPVHI